MQSMIDLHWVDGPDDDGEASNGGVEAANLASLGRRGGTSVDDELPENNQVGNAGNGVPAPLLWGALRAKGREETGQDHDHVGDDGNKDVAAWSAGQEHEIEEQEWRGDGPIDITSPVDLAEDVLVRVWDVLVLVRLDDVVVADAVSGGHGEVRAGSKDNDHGGHNMVETLALRRLSVDGSSSSMERGPTIGTFHAMPVKTMDATSMTTKTTLASN